MNKLFSNGFYYSDWATSKVIVAKRGRNDQNAIEALEFTERETEFLSHCCTEMNYRKIAEKMFISPRIVEGYRDSLFDKLNLKRGVGLLKYTIKSRRYLL